MTWLAIWLGGALISFVWNHEPEDKLHLLVFFSLLWPLIWGAYVVCAVYCLIWICTVRLLKKKLRCLV